MAETDKSRRFLILSKEQFLKTVLQHTENNLEIDQVRVKMIQNNVNDHVWRFKSMSNIAKNWIQEDPMQTNLVDN